MVSSPILSMMMDQHSFMSLLLKDNYVRGFCINVIPTPLHVICASPVAGPLLLVYDIPNCQLSNLYECAKETFTKSFYFNI